ncbi:uncharacterized protein FSUBG_13325 [Fusarium subglutinans]|uniref:DUF5071 domain-containing protein n=1 Tax=Gibberella subglutinans TaxID=42677 RepID=A0A8H5KWW5_GIBSU|nr:uncharacterized protein FSUBG_13325 [Fusarium subglutinans]KAF5580669.1 hypothetical protein FSUBG_13325 [Fusarium subglutinans]
MNRTQLTTLDEKAFAEKVPTMLWSDRETLFEDGSENIDTIRSRASEPATVEAVSSVLTSAIENEDYGTLRVHQKALYSVLFKLSSQKLQPYRPALAELAAFDISDFAHRSSHYAQTSILIQNAGQFDMVSDRTLTERVHTAEEMRPYMLELFNWLVDANNPPFTPCRDQLARFPETAAVVAAEVLAKANEEKDTEYQHFLIDFVYDCVPVGEAWIPMREHVQALVKELEGSTNEDDEDLVGEANEWLTRLERWESSGE